MPVNPYEDEILGRACYADLQSIPGRVDLVDVFRQSDAVLPIAESAIAIGARGLWLQFGIYHPQALALAQQAGLACVADRCTKIEHPDRSVFRVGSAKSFQQAPWQPDKTLRLPHAYHHDAADRRFR